MIETEVMGDWYRNLVRSSGMLRSSHAQARNPNWSQAYDRLRCRQIALSIMVDLRCAGQ
jgi:hypothetical protein